MYCLRDRVKAKHNQPYFPEKESDEQSVKNAIRVTVKGDSRPIEVSNLFPPQTQAVNAGTGRSLPVLCSERGTQRGFFTFSVKNGTSKPRPRRS